jgi:hypothetical protein
MTIEELKEDERLTVMYAIRQYGQGGHPYPDEQNINLFTPEFARECLQRVLSRAELAVGEREHIELIIDHLS